MARCNECNSVVTAKDAECYICGLKVPGATRQMFRPKKAAPPVTPISNLLFIASLMLTIVSFFSGGRLPLTLTATLSGVLFLARVVSDRLAKQRLALRPVTVTRLHY
jgi:hypothetical protein